MLASDLAVDSRLQAVAGLRAALGAGAREVQEAALVALAQIDRTAAATAGFALFARLDGDTRGLASRLLARLMPPPTPERCLAWLADADSLTGLLAAEALGEQGPAVVGLLRSHLQRLGPGRGGADDRARGRIAHALRRIGPGAAAAIPELLVLLEDAEAHRDTRWSAKQALVAIGPAAAQALFDELRARPRWAVLEALAQLPAELQARLPGLRGLLEGLRRGEDTRLHGLSVAILHGLREPAAAP